jgi:uncharacterized protein YbjT (DUF2867 family)
MKIVVIGGTGRVGSKIVARLAEHGHEVVAASPDSGVNTITGEGLAEALAGASAVVDASNSPSFEDAAALEFFETSTRNLLAAEAAAGEGHHVALSVVGADRVPESGYLRAKVAQERLIEGSAVPHSIVRATQLFEFVSGIARSALDGDVIRVSPALIQPIAADDVAGAVARTAVGSPIGGVIEVGGPEEFLMPDLVRLGLEAEGDRHEVIADPSARYFGALLEERSLLPGEGALIFETRFEDWLAAHAPARQSAATGRD